MDGIAYTIVDDVMQAEVAAKGHVLDRIEEHGDERGSSVVFVFRSGVRVAVVSPDIQLLEVDYADTGRDS